MKKQMTWLPHYWAKVSVLEIKSGKEVWEWMAFHLPHEIVQVLQELSVLDKLLSTDGFDPISLEQLNECEEAIQAEMQCSQMQSIGAIWVLVGKGAV